MAASSELISISANVDSALHNEVIDLIISKLSYHNIYKLHLSGYTNATYYLLLEGKKIITQLETLIHPDSGYFPISSDFNFNNLETITKHIWNLLICVKPQTEDSKIYKYNQLMKSVSAFLTMECEAPGSYDTICNDIFEYLIVEYLDSEYCIALEWLGEYTKWKYIFNAIDDFPIVYKLDTLSQQKYGLSILILTYLEHKDEIMHMYDNQSKSIDTDTKYYEMLVSLIKTVSGNGFLAATIISNQFVKNTFYFMTTKNHTYNR
jgi:hypothetical protein